MASAASTTESCITLRLCHASRHGSKLNERDKHRNAGGNKDGHQDRVGISAVPAEKRGGAKVAAQPIEVGNRAGENGTCHGLLACAWEEASHDGERCQSMSDDVHG